nr:hypothetical protein [Candidatus Sigynarchaeota archaeon]
MARDTRSRSAKGIKWVLLGLGIGITTLFTYLLFTQLQVAAAAKTIMDMNLHMEEMWYYVLDGLVTPETDLEGYNYIVNGHTAFTAAQIAYSATTTSSIICGVLAGFASGATVTGIVVFKKR